MTTHTHPGRPLVFQDDDCPICQGRVGEWPTARAACGCTPVTTCSMHRKES